MPRKPRPLIDRGCYHLIARGNNRQWLFVEAADFERFLDGLATAKRRYSAQLYHYCLMSNHIHLLAQFDEATLLPKFMQALLQGYGRWFKTRHRYSGHVWQGRYKSPFVAQESYFLEAGRYIERNPLRAKLVRDLQEYPWSSYPFYADGADNPLLEIDPYYPLLGPTPYQRQEAYREFVRLELTFPHSLGHWQVESLGRRAV